jgi:hypothetical protein
LTELLIQHVEVAEGGLAGGDAGRPFVQGLKVFPQLALAVRSENR